MIRTQFGGNFCRGLRTFNGCCFRGERAHLVTPSAYEYRELRLLQCDAAIGSGAEPSGSASRRQLRQRIAVVAAMLLAKLRYNNELQCGTDMHEQRWLCRLR